MVITCLAAGAAACGTTSADRPDMDRTRAQAGVASRTAAETTREGFVDAAGAPLDDLNITRETIPQPLAAIDYVYEADPAPDCIAIAREIGGLHHVLGRDYDQDAVERSLGEQSGERAGDLVLDVIRGAATSVIPFRGVVREATGAAAHDRRVERAFQSGLARRAFLRGYAAAAGCTPPAAPSTLTAPPPETPVEMRGVEQRGDEHRWGEQPPGRPR